MSKLVWPVGTILVVHRYPAPVTQFGLVVGLAGRRGVRDVRWLITAMDGAVDSATYDYNVMTLKALGWESITLSDLVALRLTGRLSSQLYDAIMKAGASPH